MESICRFVPFKDESCDIKTINFVYEADIKSLKQPFSRPLFCAHLVTEGEGILKTAGGEFSLKQNTLFFTFPGESFEIAFSDDFKYIYITFTGACVAEFLDGFGISPENKLFDGFSHTELWYDAIRRITTVNANLLTESVLYYTLSILQSNTENRNKRTYKKALIDMMLEYINVHYREQDISLGKMAEIFSYTEKYLSAYFKNQMKINFSGYINTIRIQYGIELLNSGEYTITQVASMCGYSDPVYFAKVFKKHMGIKPSEYLITANNVKGE